MPPLDLTAWLDAVDDAAPAGPNLEFDADFGALERAAQGEPERQAGETLIPAKEPEWKAVETQATALSQRTRDLRVLAHLGVARLHIDGLAAFADVLALIHQLLEARWDDLHPQLDPEDDNDPTLRANSLARLADPLLVLRFIRDLPLARSPRLGRFSWRDVQVATGAIKDDPRPEKPTETQVRSAFQDTDPAYAGATRAAAASASAGLAAILEAFDAKAGSASGLKFDELSKLLNEVVRIIDRYAVLPSAGDAAEVPEAVEAAAAPGATAPAAAMQRGPMVVTAASLTEVTTRGDALRLLDLACQYYRRYEPSSPLPLLIDRAQRLAEKNFLEILRDLAPDGVMQAQNIVSGREE